MNSRVQESFRECTMLRHPLRALQEAVLTMHLILSRMYGLPLRTPSLRSMTIHSRIYLLRFLRMITRISSKKQELNISIHLSMMQWLELSVQRADIYGHARIMTAM